MPAIYGIPSAGNSNIVQEVPELRRESVLPTGAQAHGVSPSLAVRAADHGEAGAAEAGVAEVVFERVEGSKCHPCRFSTHFCHRVERNETGLTRFFRICLGLCYTSWRCNALAEINPPARIDFRCDQP